MYSGMPCIQGALLTWAPQEGKLTALLCAESLAIFAFSPASPSAVAFLVGQALVCFKASLNSLACVETCKNFSFNLLLNIPN